MEENCNREYDNGAVVIDERPDRVTSKKCPKDYLALAIVTTVIFSPFGIPAIVHAAHVRDFWRKKRYSEAVEASYDARKWCRIGIIVGIINMVLIFVIYTIYFIWLFKSYNEINSNYYSVPEYYNF